MLLTYLIAGQALLAQSQAKAEVEIPVHNRRASIILEMIQKGQLTKVEGLKADDARGCVVVPGSSEAVAGVRQLVELFDVARRKLAVKLEINSPIDRETYDLSGNVYNNEEWKTTYGSGGLELAVVPRLNDDGTITAFLRFQSKDFGPTSMVYRMKSASTHTLVINPKTAKDLTMLKDGKVTSTTDITITIRIEG